MSKTRRSTYWRATRPAAPISPARQIVIQHGRNMAVHFSFAERGRPPVAQKHQSKSDFQDRAKSF
jgi:hypothetical protein